MHNELNKYFFDQQSVGLGLPNAGYRIADETQVFYEPNYQVENTATGVPLLENFTVGDFGYAPYRLINSGFAPLGRYQSGACGVRGALVYIDGYTDSGFSLSFVRNSFTNDPWDNAGFPGGSFPIISSGTFTTQGQCFVVEYQDSIGGGEVVLFIPADSTISFVGSATPVILEQGSYIYCNINNIDVDYVTEGLFLGAYICRFDNSYYNGKLSLVLENGGHCIFPDAATGDINWSRYFFYIDSRGLAWNVGCTASDYQYDATQNSDIVFSGFIQARNEQVFGLENPNYTFLQTATVFTGKRYQRGLTPFSDGDCITIVNANP